MSARPRILTFDVSLDRDGVAVSALGGAVLRSEEEWTAEHLLLAALSRCIVKSYRYHARRVGQEASVTAAAHGVVTRREEDGRFAFVEIRVDLEVALDETPSRDELLALTVKGERDCFIGASLAIKPDYHWTVNGEDLS